MSKSVLLLLLFLGLIAVGLGYVQYTKPNFVREQVSQSEESLESVDIPPSPSPQSVVEERVAALSNEQKIGYLIAVPLQIKNPGDGDRQASDSAEIVEVLSDSQKFVLRTLQPAVVTLFGEELEKRTVMLTVAEIEELYTQVGAIRPLIAVDHEGGSVQRLSGEGYSRLPSWQELCAFSEEEFLLTIEASARELRDSGIDTVLAPVLDVGPRGPLRDRVCSDDPAVVLRRATLLVTTYQSAGIMPVLKHFPGIGQVSVDLHTRFAATEVNPAEVVNFSQILTLSRENNSLSQPPVAVMTAHVGVTNQYADIPCSLSESCVGELLSLFPDLLLFTDALEMSSAAHVPVGQPTKSLNQISLEAVLAGNSVLLFEPVEKLEELIAVRDFLVGKYLENETVRLAINDRVRRISSLQREQE